MCFPGRTNTAEDLIVFEPSSWELNKCPCVISLLGLEKIEKKVLKNITST